MSTEIGPNLAEFRAGLRDKLASMPPVGTQGREIKTPADGVEPIEIFTAVKISSESAAPRMKPNPAQGASARGGAVAAPQLSAGTPLERIRAISSDIADRAFDPTL